MLISSVAGRATESGIPDLDNTAIEISIGFRIIASYFYCNYGCVNMHQFCLQLTLAHLRCIYYLQRTSSHTVAM